ncbi:MAG: hypothetical protein KBT20_05705 [Bacteroidales bacterium]|nr:hypothetical protein [Candidatus Liminaster caballi]
MIIHDLTRGKYSTTITKYSSSKDVVSNELIESNIIGPETILERFLESHGLHKEDAIRLIDNVPVFLVESSMANEYIAVPGNDCSVKVPADMYISETIDFDIDEWLDDMENDEHGIHRDRREWVCRGHAISDLLGVYVFEGLDNVIPCRIFIWADKIVDFVKNNTSRKYYHIDDNQKIEALYNLVLRHEIMHVLMDVAAYGIAPCPYFNYTNPMYKYVEEALANFMALLTSNNYYDNPYSDSNKVREIEMFITSFVAEQSDGYAVGLDFYNQFNKMKARRIGIDVVRILKGLRNIAAEWMNVKASFCYETAFLLAKMWKDCKRAERKCETGAISSDILERLRTNAILSIAQLTYIQRTDDQGNLL